MKKAMLCIAALASSLAVGTTSAALYEYERNNGYLGANSSHGTYEQLYTSYDSDTSQLTWTIKKANLTGYGAVDGFWLVVNNGPNPKSNNVNELAIFYADFTSNQLLAFAYNGQHSDSSINSPGILIGDYSSSIIQTNDTIGFSLDASAINTFMHPAIKPSKWAGAQFDDDIGIWFHASYGTVITQSKGGYDFNYLTQKWYDTAWQRTTVSNISIPAATFLFTPILAGYAVMRKRFSTLEESS